MSVFTRQGSPLSWSPGHAGSITSEVRSLQRTGNGYGNKRPEQQGGNARSAAERGHDGLWSAMKSGITMMTGSARPSPDSSHYAHPAMKSNTWGSADCGVKRTKRWRIWLSSTAGPFRGHLTMWIRPLTCGGNALVMTGNWISRGSKRRGSNFRMRQQQRATTYLLRISFRWRLRLRLSRWRALRCPPSGAGKHFRRCAANPEGQPCIPLIVRRFNVLVSLPAGVLPGEKGDTGAVVIEPVAIRPLCAVSSTDGRNTLIEPFCG